MPKVKTVTNKVVEEFPIESGIPIPEPKKKYNFPFDKLKVGDSFLVKCEKHDKIIYAVRNAANSFANKSDEVTEFVFRMTNDGFRVWRKK